MENSLIDAKNDEVYWMQNVLRIQNYLVYYRQLVYEQLTYYFLIEMIILFFII